MRVGLYASMNNGDVINKEIPYIAVDGGLEHLHRQNIKPLFAIGDFDSLKHQEYLDGLEVLRYPSHKNETDTELAINEALHRGYDEIDLYGVIGGRIDHFLGVLIYLRQHPQMKITLYDQVNRIFLLPSGKHEIDCRDYQYFSCFTEKDCLLTLENCDYPLHHYLLKSHDPLCISNQCHGILTIENSEDLIFIETQRIRTCCD